MFINILYLIITTSTVSQKVFKVIKFQSKKHTQNKSENTRKLLHILHITYLLQQVINKMMMKKKKQKKVCVFKLSSS